MSYFKKEYFQYPKFFCILSYIKTFYAQNAAWSRTYVLLYILDDYTLHFIDILKLLLLF